MDLHNAGGLPKVSRRRFLRSVGVASGALLLGCSRGRQFPPAQGATSAERAVNAARRFSGLTLNVGWEAGPQAWGLKHYEAEEWEKLTGISVNVVEMGNDLERFKRLSEEHRAESWSLDCASVDPAWIPDLLRMGALETLDDYIAHYMLPEDLQDILPLYRELGMWDGHMEGLFDDGDTLLLYYRSDLFGDPANQQKFQAQYGRPLGDPRSYNWQQFMDAAHFFNQQYAPNLFALAPLMRELCWALFQYRLRVNGGEFFDRQTMKPRINEPPGQEALKEVLQMLEVMVPVGTMEPSFATIISSFMSGKSAMAIFWPPLGRWADHPAPSYEAFPFIPASQVEGKVGYSLLPDGGSEMAVGFLLSVLSGSVQKEAAYLFCQWLNSPEVSLRRVIRSDNLRDPFRRSHFRSPEYRQLWPAAERYLDTIEKAASNALLDLMIPGFAEYEAAFYEMLTNVRLGTPVAQALDQLTRTWESVTQQRGRSTQQAAYVAYLKRLGATVSRSPRS